MKKYWVALGFAVAILLWTSWHYWYMPVGVFVGSLIGALVGSLIGAIVLRAAAKWAAKWYVSFGEAYWTVLICYIVNFTLRFVLSFAVGFTGSREALGVLQILLLPVFFCVQSGIISWRLELPFGKACLVSITMMGIVLGIALALGVIFFLIIIAIAS